MDYLQHISSHFLAEKSMLPAWRKLEQFIAQFVGEEYGEGHILFACHAAFPVVLTPDLLYQLWLNFQKYQNENGDPQSIHRIAVSDLLLSPLVREVGTEVFEMPEVIRTALLDCLEQRFKLEAPHRMNELAQFLMQYYNNIPQGGNYIWDHLRDIQEWHAMAYLKPDLAAHKLREAISDAVRSDQKGQQYRLQMLVEKIDHQFEKLGKEERHKDTFQTLVAYSKGMKAYHEGEYDKAVQSFSNLPTTFVENDKEVEGDVFTITVPKAVQQQLEEQKREEQKNKQKIYASYIAINDYANIPKLNAALSDARKIQNWLDGYASANQIEIHTQSLFDEAATEDAVTGLIINTLENAQTDDVVFFYFAGTGTELPKENPEAPRSTFACHEFELLRNLPIGGISDVDMRSMLRDNNPNNAFVTLVFDACNIGVSSWIDVNNPKQVMLSASRVTEEAYEVRNEGVFTAGLVLSLEKSNKETSYQRLKEQIDQFVAGDFQQTTQVFGSELAIARKFLGIGTGIDLRTTELLLETNNWRDSKAESIEQFLDAYQFEPPQNINHLLTQVRDQQSLDQLSVLNISGGQQADLFERITSELVSPAIEYHHYNLENDFGGSNPFSKVQAQSNIQQKSSIRFPNEPFELKSSLEDRIDAAHIIFLAVSPWLIRQMRLDPKIGELLEEAMMNRIPIFPILVQNCDWESTIIRRIGIYPDGRNAARKDDDFIAVYEEKLRSTLSIWQKAKVKNIKSFIAEGEWENAFKEMNLIVASNRAKNNQLLQLEANFREVRARRNSATIADRAYQININRINASILSFIEELSIEDLFDVQITFEAEEGAYAETESNNPNWFSSKPYEIGLFSVSGTKRRDILLELSKEHHYPLFELMESALSTAYEISYEGVFIFKEEGNEIFSGESRTNLEEEAKYFLDTVHQYLQWRYLLTVETTSEVISPEDYEIAFIETEEQKLKKATIKLLYERSDGLTISELSNQLALKSRKLLVATLNKLLEQQLVERYNQDQRSRNRLTDKGLQYAEFVQQNESENTSYSVKERFDDIPIYVEEGELATFEIKVSNTSKKTLYANAIALWPDYSISNQFLPLGQLQAGEELYLSNHKQEQISQQVSIDPKQWLGDTRESFKVRFKIFISTEPYETNGLNQLPLFGGLSYDTWRDIPYMLRAEDLAGELVSVEVKKIEEYLSNFDSYLLLANDELEEEIEEEEEEEEEE